MTRTNENGARQEAKAAWTVLVIYEDRAARERAAGFCDQLVGRFWAQCDFDVSWWSFAQLGDASSAEEAAGKAVGADLIAFSLNSEGDFPRPVETWVETWVTQRGEREGVLIGLLEPAVEPGGREGPRHHYLRYAAHRGAMDYLTQVPEDMSRSIPDSLDSYTQRADQVTTLLDDILHQQASPPHLLR